MAKIENTEVKEVTPTTPNLSSVLERLDRLEKENTELKKGQEKPKFKPKGKFEGARHFSYKMRAGVPVLGYTSKRKDPSKDLLYKNPKGEYISNHYLVLELANDKKVEVEVNEFGRDYTLSSKMLALDHNGEEIFPDTIKRVKFYTFKSEEYGSFNVLPNAING